MTLRSGGITCLVTRSTTQNYQSQPGTTGNELRFMNDSESNVYRESNEYMPTKFENVS